MGVNRSLNYLRVITLILAILNLCCVYGHQSLFSVVTNVLFDLRDLKVIEGNNEKYISLGTPADGENYKVTYPPEVKKHQSGSGFINMVPAPTFFSSPGSGSRERATYFFV